MADKTADAYRYAEGRCIDALVSLRRFSGNEAIESLRAAIHMIEQEQNRAKREDRLKFGKTYSRPEPFPLPGGHYHPGDEA